MKDRILNLTSEYLGIYDSILWSLSSCQLMRIWIFVFKDSFSTIAIVTNCEDTDGIKPLP